MLRKSTESDIIKFARLGLLAELKELLKSDVVIQDYEQLLAEITSAANVSYFAIMLIRQHRASAQCYQQLIKQKLIPGDARWEMKSIGSMTGLTLFSKGKHGRKKKHFIKSYNDPDCFDSPLPKNMFNELNDYVLFTILKKCGVSVPTVKLMAKDESIYISSKDMASRKKNHPAKEYRYFDLTAHLCSYDHASERLLTDINVFQDGANISGETATKNPKSYFEYPFDKISLARLIIMNNILTLRDVRDANAGVVVSREHELINAKLALVDFYTYPHRIFINRNVNSISAHLKSYTTINDTIILSMVNSLSESDYLTAFQKIDESFMSAWNEATADVKAMSFESDKEKSEILANLEIWKINFTAFKELVERAASNQPQARIAKV